jgi:HSP20 family molecular chaperone IbpA
MSDSKSKALKLKNKQEVSGSAEQTREGIFFTPDVDIFETETALTLLADIPRVLPEDLNIDLRENTLTVSGEVMKTESADEESVMIEYETGRYFRQFSLSEVIDQSKIDAQLKDGILRLTLPKVEKATPRKITVKAG